MYKEEDPDNPVFTTSVPVFEQEDSLLSEDDLVNIDEKAMQKRQIFIVSCKESVWKGGPKNISKHSEKHTMWGENQRCTRVSN